MAFRTIRQIRDEPSLPGDIYQRKKTYVCHVVDGEARPGYEPEPEVAAAYSITDIGWFDLRDAAAWHEPIVRDSITYSLLQRIQVALGYPVAQVHALV